MKKIIFYFCGLFILSGCQTYQYSSDPFIVGMRWFDRGNLELAKQYWEPLAQKNDCDGQNGMALVLYRENLSKPDKAKTKESLSYFQKSAAQGHFKSISALGDLNYCENETKKMCNTYGFKPNKTEALKDYILAGKLATSDHEKKYNQGMIDKVEKTLSPEQVYSAKSAADKWTPTPAQCTPRKII